MYYRLGTARYQPITTDNGIVLRKAGAAGPRVGDTRIEGGKSQRFNENHRWENVKEAPGQMNLFGGLATVQDAPAIADNDQPELVDPEYQAFPGQTRRQLSGIMMLHDLMDEFDNYLENSSVKAIQSLLDDAIQDLGYAPGTMAYPRYDRLHEKDPVEYPESGSDVQQQERDFMQNYPARIKQARQDELAFILDELFELADPLDDPANALAYAPEWVDTTWSNDPMESGLLDIPPDIIAAIEPYRGEFTPPDLVKKVFSVLKSTLEEEGYQPRNKKQQKLMASWDKVFQGLDDAWADYLADDE